MVETYHHPPATGTIDVTPPELVTVLLPSDPLTEEAKSATLLLYTNVGFGIVHVARFTR